MIQMMPSMPTTNLPKLNTNFSIDWIVKNDKMPTPTNNNDSKVSTIDKIASAQQPANGASVTKDYDQEISKALRMQTPPNANDLDATDRLRTASTSPKTPSLPFYENYTRHGSSVNTESHLIRPMPFMAGTATGIDPKLNYFDKPLPQPHQSAPPQLQHPLTPPMDTPMQQQHSQFLSAQIQMAAALNYQRHQASGHPQALNFSQIFSNNFHRTSYQLQPWLLNRHSRFPYGFSGDFLLHPYRKPKRIRTAFQPMQLLELENAFEGNQYVVGSERKALAKTLNLTETQVKVWFQNRRTKHKRMQQEGGSNGSNNRSISDDESNNFMDDEQIDIEDTDDYEDNNH